jgi:LacI family transcriptional regulator
MSSIKEIARLTGVSIGTVDRALHNRGRVSDETRKKVLNAAQKTGYSVNVFARNLKLSKTHSFCVVMPSPDNDSGYWKIPLNGIERGAKELEHYKIKIDYFFYNKYKPESIPSAFTKALKKEKDGIIIAPSGGSGFENQINKIPAGTPYVFFDSLVPGAECLSYIGQDSYKSGMAAAKLMQMLAGISSTAAVINFSPEDYHIIQRTKGFCDYFKQHEKNKIHVVEIPPDYKLNTDKYLDNLIAKENGRLKGIFVSSASTYLAAQYLKKRNLDGKIKLIGYDLIRENVSCLKEGIIDFIISQMSDRQGFESVLALVNHVVLKKKVKKKQFMQIDIITRENVDYYQS